MKATLVSGVRNLFPGYFALVMATGIVALGCKRLNFAGFDLGFLAIACTAYLVLCVLNIWRVAFFTSEFIADFRNPSKAPAFFTIVAGSGVVGNGLFRIVGSASTAWMLWWTGLILYAILIYSLLFTLITAKKEEFTLNRMNGGWLLLVVGLQSVASLGATLSETTSNTTFLMAVVVSAFILGACLYALLIVLLTARLLLSPLEAKDLVPTYWIMMGAAAISTLAGAEICAHAAAWRIRLFALPLMHGFTFMFWVVATAWIPLLILLGIWRHVTSRVPLRYEPMQWSIVFPLGMYAVATHAIAKTFSIGELTELPKFLLGIAVLAWLAVTVGFGGATVKTLRSAFPKSGGA